MNNDCMDMRRRIENSIGYAMEPDERAEIERHCATCEACRTYMEQLLKDDARLTEFAAPRDASIGRIQARAMERVRAAERIPSRRFDRVVARLPRFAAIAAAAAAIIITFVAIDLIRGAHNGPVPAFAAVQEKMQKADNVVFRVQVWSLGQWTTQEEGMSSSRLFRNDFGDSIIVFDFGHGDALAELRLYPSEKRAYIFRVVFPPGRHDAFVRHTPDPVRSLAVWYKAKGFSFVRKERLNGKNAAVYEKCPNVHKKQTNRMTAWVDLDTALPIRFEMVSPPNSNAYYYGLRLRDFQRDGSQAAGWSDVKAGEPCLILDNFKWNTSADTSYFSLVPPSGYVVETGRSITPGQGSGYVDSCQTKGRLVLESIVRALSIWRSLSGNVFPDDLNDLTDSTKVKPLLISGFLRGGNPGEEFRAAYRKGEELLRNAGVISLIPDGITLHYFGKGASFGDSRKIICWFKDWDKPDCPGKSGNGPYLLIYGDLHITESPTPPKSARE